MAVMLHQSKAPYLRAWLARRLPLPSDLSAAVMIGFTRNDVLVAAVAYTNYTKTNIEISMAADRPSWASASNIFTALAYPFLILGCDRVTCLVQVKNKRTRKFLVGIGFKCEGALREWWGPGRGHALIYGYLKSEFLKSRWYKGASHHGEKGIVSVGAAARA